MISENKINKANKLLIDFENFTKIDLDVYSNILNLSKGLNYELQNENNCKLKNANELIKKFKKSSLNKSNIFLKAGFYPDENNLSDALAFLFDPNENHKLRTKPLEILLRIIDKKKYANLIKKIRLGINEISVFREFSEEKTRLDIEIIGKEFIIFIENKVWVGSETIINNEYQTNREWKALIKKYEYFRVPPENCICVYLTPQGKKAKNKHFIPVRVDTLISELLKNLKDENDIDDIRAFLEFYYYKF